MPLLTVHGLVLLLLQPGLGVILLEVYHLGLLLLLESCHQVLLLVEPRHVLLRGGHPLVTDDLPVVAGAGHVLPSGPSTCAT